MEEFTNVFGKPVEIGIQLGHGVRNKTPGAIMSARNQGGTFGYTGKDL